MEITGNLTKIYIVLQNFKTLISVTEFYLVKCYIKHTASIWYSFLHIFRAFFTSQDFFHRFLERVKYPYFMYLCQN